MALPLLLLVAAAPLWADATKADPVKAEKVVKDELEKVKADTNLAVQIKDEALARTFPGQTFFAVIFRQFPVARLAPAPLKSSNIYAVDGDGKVVLINSIDSLKTFFNKGRFGAKADAKKDVVRSYLRLVQELHQDGFYKFKTEDDSLKVEGDKASGKVMITGGGNGDISVAITFADGSIASIQGESKIARGIRPRCQATLLLDVNPLVREIVEQDLQVMGRAALPYLADQHAKASPELKKAIERVRKQILASDR
jgi:hypothetical protein